MGEVIDSVSYPFISPNLSWSRSLDGESDWTICHSPTPMMTNLTTDIQDEFSASSRLEIYPNPATDRTYFKVALEDGSDIII